MGTKGISSPLLLKFSKAYERNPQSRVFAPLAEHYRKVGMIDQALIILKKGIRIHPEYAIGHQTYAACLLDKKRFKEAYETLYPFVAKNRENSRLQELFADVCYQLGYFDQALETYKYLLFLNPKDKVAISKVNELEDKIITKFQIPSRDNLAENPEASEDEVYGQFVAPFKVDNLSGGPLDDEIDGWTQVDFRNKEQKNIYNSENCDSTWVLEKELKNDEDATDPEIVLTDEIKGKDVLPEEKSGFKFELQKGNKDSRNLNEELDELSSEITPVVTHTLVDLYCTQGHVEKAYELISKILELNPNDESTIKKHGEIRNLLNRPEVEVIQVVTEEEVLEDEEGHSALMSHFDRSVVEDEIEEEADDDLDKKVELVESSFQDFLDKISRRAKIVKNSIT